MKRRPKSRPRFTKPSITKPGQPFRTLAALLSIAVFSARPLSGLDQNGDGLNDLWQQQYSVPSADADLDYTGNGLTNRQKSLLGLDPRDPNTGFRLNIVSDSANAQLRLQLNTVYGKRYQIESSNDLLSWSAFRSPIVGTGQSAEMVLPLSQTSTFFRATYAGDIDADGDGLAAWEERFLGTDDNNPDTDNDGIPDIWEYVHGLNPLVNDATADPDGDGATNFQEYQAGTDPNDYYNGIAPILVIVSGNNQVGRINSFLSNPLVAKVTNSQNQPLVNAPISFDVAAGGGELSTSVLGGALSSTITLRTGSDGTATIYFKLPSNPLSDMSIAVSAGMARTAFTAHYAANPAVSIISGNDQEGLPGKILPLPLVIRLIDPSGEPIASSAITFSVASGDGALVARPFDPAPSVSITLNTNEEGLAWVYYLQGATNGVTSSIAVTTNGDSIGRPHTQTAGTDVTVSFSANTSIPPHAAQSIAVGDSHTLALYSDGTVWAWGDNTYGELGDGTTASEWHRTEVLNLTNVIAVATHGNTSAALRADGTVWTWGANYDYALGNGTTVDYSTVAVQVLQTQTTPLTNVVAIASGYSHFLALKSDGTVWAWGANWAYQLANESGNDSSFALQVLMSDGTALHNVVSIACGDDYNLVLKSDGTVWSWGDNSYRQLGTNDTNWAQVTPAPVMGLTNVVAITGGAYHSLALKDDGTAWSWGKNSQGCLGNGTSSGNQTAPGQVINLNHIIAVAAGNSHSLALKSDETVWSWGDNSAGQLGINTSSGRSLSPVRTQNLNSIISVAAAGYQTVAVGADGSLFGWGANDFGQLGNPTPTTETMPTSVRDFLVIEDPDHDGLVNWREYMLGGNPNAFSTANDAISDGWKAGYNLTLIDSTLATSDLTGKGLTVFQDYQLGTNPTKFSFVDDGIADGWKFRYGLDLFDLTLADADFIGKGYSVRTDYQFGTNPTKLSTLDDGIPDAWKVSRGINPLDSSYAGRDDDGDGLTNAEEYPLGTDPLDPDTDDDGFSDGIDGWPTDGDLHPPRLPNRSYALIDIGDGVARAINSANQIIGDNVQGFLWEAGQRHDFARHGFGTDVAVGINDAGVALFNHNDGPPTLWNIATATQTSLQITPDGSTIFDFDPNIVYSQVILFSTTGISNSGYVAGTFRWYGSPSISFVIDGIQRAAAWTINYSAPLLLGTVADANDRLLAVNDHDAHGFYKDYDNTVDSFNFHGRYDNRLGLDNQVFDVLINNANQILGTTRNQDRVDQWGFPFFGDAFSTITLWTNNQPEIVAQSPLSFLRARAINDDGVIMGLDEATRASLWVKVDGQWKKKDLGLGDFRGPNQWFHMNKNLQLVFDDHLYQNHQLLILPSMPGETYPVLKTLGINEQGIIVGQAYNNSTSATRAVVLFPAELMVDGNRDGQMSIDDPLIHDRDITSEERPYRFWLNDDDDTELNYNGEGGASTGPTEEEKVPAPRPDYSLRQIASKRNLEDFSRLWIYFSGLQDAITSGTIQVGLRWKNVTPGTSPAVNIYPSADAEGSDSYVKDDNAAQAQIGDPIFNEAVRDKYGVQTIYVGTRFIFKTDYWAGLTTENLKKCLLFEGAGEGKGELEIVFYDQNDVEIGNGGSLWLDLKDIKKMYRRVDITGRNQWPNTAFDPDPAETKQAIIFVHGWNMSPEGASNYAETMFKRLWQRGFKGRYAAVRWNTDWSSTFDNVPLIGETVDAYLADYNGSEHEAWLAGTPLKNFIETLVGFTKNVVAHSMGNIVVGGGLRHDMTIDNYALLNPAVPAASYDEGTYLQQFPAPGAFGYYYWDTRTPDDDPDFQTRALAYRRQLTSAKGNLINFYLPNDRATTYAWDFNNNTFKPARGFFYDRNESDGFKLWQAEGLVRRTLHDPEEAMPFADQSWSKAAGAESRTAGAIKSSVNLSSEEYSIQGQTGGFQDDHSAEFHRSVQQLQSFYRELLRQLAITQNQ